MEKVLYEELTPAEFEARLAQAPIAYLPLGTLEWHGRHLPLGSDGMQSQGFFKVLAQRAGGIVLPMLFVAPDLTKDYEGTTYIGMDFYARPEGQAPRQLPGSAYYVDSELFLRLLDAIMAQLARAGFKIVVGHGHGPSTKLFMTNAKELGDRYGLTLLSCWSDQDKPGLGIQTDHAGANETSLMMHFHPDLVDMSALDPDPAVFPEAVLGQDPRTHASASLGAQAVDAVSARMAKELTELLKSKQ